MNKILLAQQFAHEAHDAIHQKRKYSGEPYWVHTDEVALLAEQNGLSVDAVCAAHLHDVEEDVASSKVVIPHPERYGLSTDGVYYYDVTAIACIFGAETAGLVMDLTDQFTSESYPNWNRAARKEKECARLETISDEGKSLKLCDLIANTKSIVENDPAFAKTYIKEKMAALPMLVDGKPALLERASRQVIDACKTLGLQIPTVINR
jgi:hypothetical protein